MKTVLLVLSLLLASCGAGNRDAVDLRKLGEQLGEFWTEYFLATNASGKADALLRIERLLDQVIPRMGETHQVVLNQRLLLNGTRAIDELNSGNRAQAERYASKAFDAWILFDPTLATLQETKTPAEKLALVTQHVASMNGYAAQLARERQK